MAKGQGVEKGDLSCADLQNSSGADIGAEAGSQEKRGLEPLTRESRK